jgi:hypothetical protein
MTTIENLTDCESVDTVVGSKCLDRLARQILSY